MTSRQAFIGVIDDDAAVLRALSRLLIACNYRVRAFGSVEAFLSEPGWKPNGDDQLDCLVVDVHMLGLSGLELQSEPSVIRAGLPIVFVTGAGDASLRERAMADGAVEFLQKPFTDDQLIRAIDRALDYGRAHQPFGPSAGNSALS
jgi:FixJ family two-component response regulator